MKCIYYCFYFFIFYSCSSGTKNEAEIPAPINTVSSKDTSLPGGIIIHTIKCKADSSIKYALYLPKKYPVNEKLPVIFFFDSHGSGELPLNKYKELAEKYGYILAGSNNSKNGMRWEDNEPQIKIFMNDVKEKINVDAKRIYACGFSGGSRVASSVAIFDGGISGVIGMGAGFPSLSEPIKNKFDYIGFAGNEDFNMNEMISLAASMDNSSIRHHLIIFNGKHEWAPAEEVENAFLWCEMNAMKDGLISRKDSLVNNFIKRNESKIDSLEKRKNIYDEFILTKRMANFLDGLTDISSCKKKANDLKNSEEMKKILQKKEKLSKEEMMAQQAYRNNFLLKNLEWWTKEINSLNQKLKIKNDLESAAMNKRLLSYLSLLAYMNCSNALQQRQLDLLETYLKIYEMAEPKNSEHQYMFAELYAMKNNNDKTISYLQNAVILGFNDSARMQSDTLFSSVKNSEAFSKIIEEIKNNKHD
ncbi:MAG: hypothetical protein HY063_07785 [Bacteroidetes bacterium]|nr:hypothetical protein [Bacteroidota bacterium]